MKIVCESCGAKYSIADEKVKGKVFKIRCKKCSNVIVVKGDSGQADAADASQHEQAGSYGGDAPAAEWYVVIDGEQVGPVTAAEVEDYVGSGRVEVESYAWRDGLADWTPLVDLEEFQHLARPAPQDEEKTTVAGFPVEGGGDEEAYGGGYDEDATSVMPAEEFRAQLEGQGGDLGFGGSGAFGAAEGGQELGYGQEEYGGYPGEDAGYDDYQQGQAYGEQGGFGSGDGSVGSGYQDDHGWAQDDDEAFGGSGGDLAQAYSDGGGYGDGGGFGASEGYGDGVGYDSGGAGGWDEGASGGFGAVESPQASASYGAEPVEQAYGGGQFEEYGAAQTGGSEGYEGFGAEQEGSQDVVGGFGDGSYGAGGGFDDYGNAASEEASGGGTGGGMFASFDSSEATPASDEGRGQAGQGEGTANDLFASRNENSVLFSLSSLDQVGAVGGSSGPSPGDGGGGPDLGAMGATPSAGGSPATTEGSGLIDIQALASAHKSMSGGGGAAKAAEAVAGPDDPFGAGTMSMPALMPMGSKKSNKGLIVGLSVAGVLLVATVGAAAYVFVQSQNQPAPQERIVYKQAEPAPADPAAQAKAKAEAEQAAAAAAKAEAGEEPAEAGGDDQGAAKEEGAEQAEEEKAQEKAAEEKRAESKKTETKVAAKTTKPRTERRQEKPRKARTEKSTGDDIDDIIGSVGKSSGSRAESSAKAEEPAPAADPGVPKSLSRSDVQGTIRKYSGRVFNCGRSANRNNLSGKIFINIQIAPSGRVSSASVLTDKFKGTDVGRCIVGVAKSMKFPKAQQSLNIKQYPFTVR